VRVLREIHLTILITISNADPGNRTWVLVVRSLFVITATLKKPIMNEITFRDMYSIVLASNSRTIDISTSCYSRILVSKEKIKILLLLI